MLSHRFGRYISMTVLLLGAMIGLRSAEGQDNFSLKSTPGTGVPEVTFYHGMVLDKDLREIPPTIDNVSFVLRRFTEALASRSSTASNARLVDMLRTEPAPEMDKKDELLRSVAMARWLLQDPDLPQKESLEPMLGALEVWATIPTGDGINVQLRNNTRLRGMVAAMNLDIQDEDILEETPPATTPYMKECRAAQVPIPPDWGDDRWKFQEILLQKDSFVRESATTTGEVWTFTDPNVPGLCVGLPRRLNTTRKIGLFGIICQSATTGKACFWDNVGRASQERLPPEESERMKIATIYDGLLIEENCTNCHRGENVFIIHPRTAVDLSDEFNTDSGVDWYTPIPDQTRRLEWGNPGPMKGLTKCSGCHQMPELVAKNNPDEKSPYCRILKQVVDNTMPPGGAPAGWKKPQSHQEDVNLLRTKCKELGLE